LFVISSVPLPALSLAQAPAKPLIRLSKFARPPLNMLGRFLAFVSEYCYDPSTAQADIDDFMAFAREHERKASGTISAPYWSARTRKIYDPEKESHGQ
ncbi:hypothetical protein, partial [Burkholderia pyrrocinia]|uniref:hypothetical protein n=1 Tax=Burkholderia pyrrocinia TaxID=60550 RepID=UPI0015899AB7